MWSAKCNSARARLDFDILRAYTPRRTDMVSAPNMSRAMKYAHQIAARLQNGYRPFEGVCTAHEGDIA
jgi:hypothetical protein